MKEYSIVVHFMNPLLSVQLIFLIFFPPLPKRNAMLANVVQCHHASTDKNMHILYNCKRYISYVFLSSEHWRQGLPQ